MNIIEQATALGREHGHNVGSWVIDGNTSAQTARSIIKGYDDGDPAVMDMQPSPLSGEWADDPTPASVLGDLGLDADDDHDDVLDAYELGFSDGYWTEVIRAARCIAE